MVVKIILILCLVFLSDKTPNIKFSTVDQETRNKISAQFEMITIDSTSDHCGEDEVIIVSTTDGAISLTPGKTVYFKINEQDAFTNGGGWYWRRKLEINKTQLLGSVFIMASRDKEGFIHWQSFTLKIK